MPGLPVHHQVPESSQTHIHVVGDAIQPSHPLPSPSPPVHNPSQHQSLFQSVNSSHKVAKVLEFQDLSPKTYKSWLEKDGELFKPTSVGIPGLERGPPGSDCVDSCRGICQHSLYREEGDVWESFGLQAQRAPTSLNAGVVDLVPKASNQMAAREGRRWLLQPGSRWLQGIPQVGITREAREALCLPASPTFPGENPSIT